MTGTEFCFDQLTHFYFHLLERVRRVRPVAPGLPADPGRSAASLVGPALTLPVNTPTPAFLWCCGPQRHRSRLHARPLPSRGLQRKPSISHTILLSLCYWHLAFVFRMIYDNCVAFESVTEMVWNPFCVPREKSERLWPPCRSLLRARGSQAGPGAGEWSQRAQGGSQAGLGVRV